MTKRLIDTKTTRLVFMGHYNDVAVLPKLNVWRCDMKIGWDCPEDRTIIWGTELGWLCWTLQFSVTREAKL